jgi:aspartyl-tRNA(Asn)/glutamyl-tRNA(Gln) amidotransferase subunit A
MKALHELGVAESAAAIRQGKVSAVELSEALLERIDALSDIQAWVHVDPEFVRAEARDRQAELDRGSSAPLLGVPVGIKDIFFTAGMPTTACSRVYADFVPDHDATSVALLRKAGAIVLGKTVTTEFAYRDPSPTLNPWNRGHTPGGSSSGSAAAVAARMCPVALGSQTRGSVLRPASYNGTVGLKPTFGRVSRFGVIPLSWSFDHVGWMTRSVEDAALLLRVLAGPDSKDPTTLPDPESNFCEVLGDSGPPHIGVLREYFHDNAVAEVREHTEEIAGRLASAGARVEPLELPPSFATASDDQLTILTVEAASFHQPMLEEKAELYGPHIRELIEAGLRIDAVRYSRALENRLQFIADTRSLASRADVLLTPSTPTPAPGDLSVTGSAMFQGPWTSCGLPTVTVPSGLSPAGLPLGIQLVAGPLAERRLLTAALWCERQLALDLRPPLP